MKKIIEKLIAKLEELSIPIYDSDGEIENKVVFTDIAKNIVNELAEEYKNTNIITDFLQYARDNADNYDTNEGWSLADLIDLSIKFTEEYSANTPQNSADGWIPCSERLPNVGVTVLCYWGKSSICENTTSYYYTLMHRNEDNIWISDFGICIGFVIAWMPLPEPYKEGE